MERQVQALMVEDEDGVEEQSEHEWPPLGGISKNIVHPGVSVPSALMYECNNWLLFSKENCQ